MPYVAEMGIGGSHGSKGGGRLDLFAVKRLCICGVGRKGGSGYSRCVGLIF